MDLKKEAARAALEFIKPNTSVGLGAGGTMAHLLHFLLEPAQREKKLTLYTSSYTTTLLMQEAGVPIADTATVSSIDVYFDGCDQVNHQLEALKSGGGVHSREKLLASMAGSCIILGDEPKWVERFDLSLPLVFEILPDALGYISGQLKKMYPGMVISIRKAERYDGPVFTKNGNLLIDCRFVSWPPLDELQQTKALTGVVEHSLFYGIATHALIAGVEGITTYQR